MQLDPSMNCVSVGGGMEGHGEVTSRRSNTITKFMYSLFERQSMCDLFLLCSDGQIGAHRLVLGSNSEVMSKQFDQCLQQKVQKRSLCNPNRQSFPPQPQQQQQLHHPHHPHPQQQQQLQHHYQTQQQQQQMNHPQQRHYHQQQQQQHHQLGQQFQQQQNPPQKNICCDPDYFERSVQELKRKIQAMGIDDDETQYDFNGHNSAPNVRGSLPNQSDYYRPQECQSLYSMPKPEQPVYCPQLAVNDHVRFFDPRAGLPQDQLCSDSRLICSRGPSSPGRMNLLQQVAHLKQLLESKRQSLCPQQPSEHDQLDHRRSQRSQHQQQQQQQFQQQRQQPQPPQQRRQQFSQHLCSCMNDMKISNNNNKFKTFGLHNSNSSCNNNNDGDTNNNTNNNNINNNKRISDLLNSSYSNDALKNNNSNSYQNNICFVGNNNNLVSNKINCYNNTNVSNSDIDTDQDEAPGALHFSMEKYSLEVVCILIHFLYTGDASHISVDNMEFLLQLSLELQIPLLHKACVKHIISTITPCNASTYLLLVDKYDMKNIRKVVLCFMLENMVGVMQSPDFLTLPHPWVKIIMGSQEARGMIAGECNNSEDQIELMIFDTLVRWIDYDREQRYSLAPALMGEVVHLEALSVQQLVEVVEGVGWLFEMPGVRDILTSICQNIPSQKSFPCGVSNFDFSTIC